MPDGSVQARLSRPVTPARFKRESTVCHRYRQIVINLSHGLFTPHPLSG